MTEKIHKMGVKVLLMALVSLTLAVSQGLTQDLSSILEEAEVKYAKFEEEIKDMTIVQDMKMVTSEGEMTSEMKMLKKGKKFRMETAIQMSETSEVPEEMGEMEIIIIYDGDDTWMISPFMGKKKLSGEDEKQYQRERNWWELISEKAEIVETEKVGKRECYVVEIEEEEEEEEFPFTKLWLDKKNLVLIKGESKKPEEKTVLLVHSNFRKIKGDWEMPYKTEIYVDGELMSTSRIKSLEINKGLSDDLFDPDKVKVKGFRFKMPGMMRKMLLEKEKE